MFNSSFMPGHDSPRVGLSRFEFRGAWSLVSVIAMAVILVVPFTNIHIPGTNNTYSVMSVLWLILLICFALAPSFIERGWSSILAWMALLFAIRYIYGWLMSRFPEFMADSTRNMIRPLLWAWILAAVMRNDRYRRLACDLLVSTCTIAASLHLLGIGAGEQFGGTGMERISAFKLNANVIGVIYATGFVIALARVIQPRTGYRAPARVLFAAASLICLAAMKLTGSRSAALFTVLGSTTLLALELRRAKWSMPAILAVVLATGAIWGVVASQTVISERANTLRESGLKSEDRVRMMPVLIDQFSRSPIIGLGPENYRIELGERSGTGDPQVGIVAHNQILMFAVEMGLFGIIPFVATSLLLMSHAWKQRFEEGALPFALAFPCIVTAWVTSNVAFHWHFHFVVAFVASGYNAVRFRRGLPPEDTFQEQP